MSGPGIFIIAVYTLVGLTLVAGLYAAVRKASWRWFLLTPALVALIALAVAPFVEERIIAARYEDACKTAGVHIRRQVEVDGYYDARMRSGYEEIMRYGYAWMEHPARDHKNVEHLERVDGQWRSRVIDRPTARYHLIQSASNRSIAHKVWMDETVIIDSQTNEVISRQTVFKRTANAIDQMWFGGFGSTLEICHGSAPQPLVPLSTQTFIRARP